MACLKEDRAPVLLMHFDESLPSAYGAPDEPSVAIALLLSPEGAFGMDFAPSREGGGRLPRDGLRRNAGDRRPRRHGEQPPRELAVDP